jgi:hypothetical protein
MSTRANTTKNHNLRTKEGRARYIADRTDLSKTKAKRFMRYDAEQETTSLDRAVGRTIRKIEVIADADDLYSSEKERAIKILVTGIKRSVRKAGQSVKDAVDSLAEAICTVIDLFEHFGTRIVAAFERFVTWLTNLF